MSGEADSFSSYWVCLPKPKTYDNMSFSILTRCFLILVVGGWGCLSFVFGSLFCFADAFEGVLLSLEDSIWHHFVEVLRGKHPSIDIMSYFVSGICPYQSLFRCQCFSGSCPDSPGLGPMDPAHAAIQGACWFAHGVHRFHFSNR